MKNRISGFNLVFISSLIFIFLSGCSNEEKITKLARGGQPDQILESFTTFGTKDGQKKWRLLAVRAKIFEKQNKVEVKNFTVDFYSANGKAVKARLSANSGRIDTLKNDLYTEGKSTVETQDKEILKTSDLVYKSDKGMIYSDSDVTLIRKDAVVTGRGLEATPDLSSIIIKQNMVELKK